MRRPSLALLTAAALALPGAVPASLPAPPPPGDISDNVEFVANLPEASMAIAVGFIDDTLFVSTVTGIFSYDVSDPAAPELLGVLPMYIWQNEDMDIDEERELLFISRDPRGFTTQVSSGSTFPTEPCTSSTCRTRRRWSPSATSWSRPGTPRPASTAVTSSGPAVPRRTPRPTPG